MPTGASQHQDRINTTRLLHAAIAMAAITSTVAAIDQLSKTMALTRLSGGPAQGPGPFWFRLIANRGALMGFPLPTWALLVAVAVIVAIAISALTKAAPIPILFGWALIVGGAVGNLIDRLRHRPRFPDHAVVDWIALTWLPTFNLADVAIVAGLAFVTFSATPDPAPERTTQQ